MLSVLVVYKDGQDLRPGFSRLAKRWESGRFELLTSEWQLRELHRASRYPKLRKYLEPAEADTMIWGLRLGAQVLDELPAVDLASGPDDNPLLATALAS